MIDATTGAITKQMCSSIRDFPLAGGQPDRVDLNPLRCASSGISGLGHWPLARQGNAEQAAVLGSGSSCFLGTVRRCDR
jgi:hypothetical protein